MGNQLEKLRKHKKMSQGAIGKILGISQTMVSYLENGINPLTEEYIKKLSETLNCDPNELLGFENVKLPTIQPELATLLNERGRGISPPVPIIERKMSVEQRPMWFDNAGLAMTGLVDGWLLVSFTDNEAKVKIEGHDITTPFFAKFDLYFRHDGKPESYVVHHIHHEATPTEQMRMDFKRNM